MVCVCIIVVVRFDGAVCCHAICVRAPFERKCRVRISTPETILGFFDFSRFSKHARLVNGPLRRESRTPLRNYPDPEHGWRYNVRGLRFSGHECRVTWATSRVLELRALLYEATRVHWTYHTRSHVRHLPRVFGEMLKRSCEPISEVGMCVSLV